MDEERVWKLGSPEWDAMGVAAEALKREACPRCEGVGWYVSHVPRLVVRPVVPRKVKCRECGGTGVR